MLHQFNIENNVNAEPDLCDICGKSDLVLIHIKARHELISKQVELTLSAPIVKEAIEMLSVAQQKKVKENISSMVDRYAADDTYTLCEGSGY